jgi:hypothetical protein
MQTLSYEAHRWAVLVEHGLLRLLLLITGVALALPGLLLAASVIFLPLGLALTLMGIGVIAWAVAGEPFEAHPAFEAQPAGAAAPVFLHLAWNCRWTQIGFRLTNVREEDQPETAWVCVRETGRRRPVTDADCSHCPQWEPTGRHQLHAA